MQDCRSGEVWLVLVSLWGAKVIGRRMVRGLGARDVSRFMLPQAIRLEACRRIAGEHREDLLREPSNKRKKSFRSSPQYCICMFYWVVEL